MKVALDTLIQQSTKNPHNTDPVLIPLVTAYVQQKTLQTAKAQAYNSFPRFCSRHGLIPVVQTIMDNRNPPSADPRQPEKLLARILRNARNMGRPFQS
jgi:hypothetical protein